MTIIITVREMGGGRYDCHHCDRYVVTSAQPFCDAARVLIAWGFDPSARLVMRRQGSERDDLISTLGATAGLEVTTSNFGSPVFRTFKGGERRVSAPSVAPIDPAATPVPLARAA